MVFKNFSCCFKETKSNRIEIQRWDSTVCVLWMEVTLMYLKSWVY